VTPGDWANVATANGTGVLAVVTILIARSTMKTNAAMVASQGHQSEINAASLAALKEAAAARDFDRRCAAWLTKKREMKTNEPSFRRTSLPPEEQAFIDRALVDGALAAHPTSMEHALYWT
jgi:hypothetical protein